MTQKRAARFREPLFRWNESSELTSDLDDVFRSSARQIAQILKGAIAGNTPLRQATKFQLVINVKTAKTLGLEMPSTLLARADEVIE